MRYFDLKVKNYNKKIDFCLVSYLFQVLKALLALLNK